MYMYNMYNDSINRCLPIPKEAAKEKRRLQWIRLQKVAIRRCTGFWWIYIYMCIYCIIITWGSCVPCSDGKDVFWGTMENPYTNHIFLDGGLEHGLIFFHSVGNVIILTDELIFFRGVAQPPTSYIYIYIMYYWPQRMHISEATG